MSRQATEQKEANEKRTKKRKRKRGGKREKENHEHVLDCDGYYEYNLYSNFPGGNNSNAQIGINSYATGNFDLEFSTEVQGVINEITKLFPHYVITNKNC